MKGKWEIFQAKNGEDTLKLNGVSIYSFYNPVRGVQQWINKEIDLHANRYLLIGLGLGYHLAELSKLVSNKPIVVYFFDQQELEIFKKRNNGDWWRKSNIQIVSKLDLINLNEAQVLLPNVWLKAIGENHPLFYILEVIKINQVSYEMYGTKMLENFNENLKLNDSTFSIKENNRTACLVAAGPSLDETIDWLKEIENSVDIYVVGAALKSLVAYGISPDATVISDASNEIIKQFNGVNYCGNLYYLSTANNECVRLHSGKKYILFQQGYKLAEDESKRRNLPLIETGGSVATTTFSLLEKMGYQTIILFGQDLGFLSDSTHSQNSTSNRNVADLQFVREIVANDGSKIKSTAMFQTFLYWYNLKMEQTSVKVFNTARQGAKINNVKYINKQQLKEIIGGDDG